MNIRLFRKLIKEQFNIEVTPYLLSKENPILYKTEPFPVSEFLGKLSALFITKAYLKAEYIDSIQTLDIYIHYNIKHTTIPNHNYIGSFKFKEADLWEWQVK